MFGSTRLMAHVLNGWLLKVDQRPATATIFFHGNGGNISNVSWMGQRFAKHGFNVLLIDYRGTVPVIGVAAEESGLYADGDACAVVW